MLVQNPYPGQKEMCPGCDNPVWFDPIDGWIGYGGMLCLPPGTRHSDHIVVVSHEQWL